MTRGAVEAYTSRSGSYWLGRAVAFRHAADSASGFSADQFLIQSLRRSMRTAAYKLRAELLIERMNRKEAAA